MGIAWGRTVAALATLAQSALFLSTDACSAEGCTDAGCRDGAHLSIHAPEDVWQIGDYSLELTLDGTEYACSLTVPEGLSYGPNGLRKILCTPELSGWVAPVATCTQTPNGSNCTLVDGRWTLELDPPGLPKTVRVEIMRDQAPLFDQTKSFQYQTVSPNGGGCGPHCSWGTASFTMTATE